MDNQQPNSGNDNQQNIDFSHFFEKPLEESQVAVIQATKPQESTTTKLAHFSLREYLNRHSKIFSSLAFLLLSISAAIVYFTFYKQPDQEVSLPDGYRLNQHPEGGGPPRLEKIQ